jgi:hypothetical protein
MIILGSFGNRGSDGGAASITLSMTALTSRKANHSFSGARRTAAPWNRPYLRVEVGQVAFYGPLDDARAGGGLVVTHPARYQQQDLELPIGECPSRSVFSPLVFCQPVFGGAECPLGPGHERGRPTHLLVL